MVYTSPLKSSPFSYGLRSWRFWWGLVAAAEPREEWGRFGLVFSARPLVTTPQQNRQLRRLFSDGTNIYSTSVSGKKKKKTVKCKMAHKWHPTPASDISMSVETDEIPHRQNGA